MLACLFWSPDLLPPSASNPLPTCPTPTNCVRVSQSYSVPADRLFAATQQALDTLSPIAHEQTPNALRASAVYRVGGLFKDDVAVAITSQNSTSTVHLRSESRIGLYDFEVNRRRVRTLLDAIDAALSPPSQ